MDFFQNRHQLFQYIYDSTSSASPELPKNDIQTHIGGLYSLCGISPENLSTVISIANYLKTREEITGISHCPQRFKIPQLCSFTIVRSGLLIHLKKKENCYHLGKGTFSSFYVCLFITTKRVAYVAEGTYKISWTENGKLRQISSPKNPHSTLSDLRTSIALPRIRYQYTSSKKPEEPSIKCCRIFPLYHANLKSVLNSSSFTQSATAATIWSLMQQAIRCCQQLHQKGFIHRDIKKANYLIRFPIYKNGIDWANPKLVLGDIDMITETTKAHDYWKETTQFWPPEDVKGDSCQSTSADVYALSFVIKDCHTILKKISQPSEEDSQCLQELIAYAKDYKSNPSADNLYEMVTDYLTKKPSKTAMSADASCEGMKPDVTKTVPTTSSALEPLSSLTLTESDASKEPHTKISSC